MSSSVKLLLENQLLGFGDSAALVLGKQKCGCCRVILGGLCWRAVFMGGWEFERWKWVTEIEIEEPLDLGKWIIVD